MKKPSVVSSHHSHVGCNCIQGSEPVKDSQVNLVILGEQYFIQPVKTASNNGDGLVPAVSNTLCPLGIIQTLLPYQPGLPVSFKLPYPVIETIVKTSIDVNIEFMSDNWPDCKEFSKFWEVDVSSSSPKEPAILIGGEPHKNNSWFKIEKAGEGAGAHTYKLTTSTGTVGVTPARPRVSGPQLVITNDTAKTILVKFKIIEYATTAATSTSRVEKLGL